jgi:two-component system, OmpR family, alkaline phosphatase synthesis response regulator PhoP
MSGNTGGGMKKIMIVDDEVEVVELLKSRLVNSGFRVCTAYDGNDALAVVKKEKPDLILLDVILPTVNGYDVCGLLKKDNATKKIPIIMLTVKGKIGDIDEGILSGADDYIAKPYELNELLDRIKKII